MPLTVIVGLSTKILSTGRRRARHRIAKRAQESCQSQRAHQEPRPHGRRELYRQYTTEKHQHDSGRITCRIVNLYDQSIGTKFSANYTKKKL